MGSAAPAGHLLADRLPADAYSLQHTFRSGERVDAVIRVDKLVPVDAKFPLDNFERLVDAQDDESRQMHEKAFARDVKIHIDAIESKYIRPDEGTYDFALMYLPSETIYYELACGKTGALLAYAHQRNVVPSRPTPSSPICNDRARLKGMQIEQHAQEVMAYCAQLQKDFGTFRADSTRSASIWDTPGASTPKPSGDSTGSSRSCTARPSRRSSRRPKWPSSPRARRRLSRR